MVAVFGVVVPAASAPNNHEDEAAAAAGTALADGTVNDIGGGGSGENVAAVSAAEPAKTVKLLPAPSKQHNAKLLNRLGMKRVRTNGGGGGGPNHHRKRLASQSRSKYGGADGGKGGSDSQMFIVKLPPHSHYYDDGTGAAAVHQRLQHQHHKHQHHQPSPYKSLNTVPVGFVSNGKPGKVYHWNLPAIKHAARYKHAGDNEVAAANQQRHQMYGQPGEFDAAGPVGSKMHVPRRTLYYKPRAAGKPVKKSFVNNGKPNGFYVVSNKNAAAPQYHKIVKAYYGSDDD